MSNDARPLWLQLYVFLVVLLLPLDWFAPTGDVLRELGAKPANLLLLAGGLVGLLRGMPGPAFARAEYQTLFLFAAWLTLGFGAALLNFVLGWSGWHHSRSPLTQLLSQSSLVVACAIAIVGNARLLRGFSGAFDLVAKFIPFAAIFHFAVFLLEATSVINDAGPPLLLFRAADKGVMERPSALFSEPSYFGTFAALYGSALLALTSKQLRRFIYVAISGLLYAAAVWVGAKTFVVVAGAQAGFFVLRRTTSARAKAAAMLLIVIVGLCAVFFIQTYSALDVEANLSTAIRFGSTVLAANAALDGYGLTGIGFGQFHFFYRNEFAPDFLFASWEGLLQLSPDADNRASTYNFFVRVLVETGVLGLLLLLVALSKLWFSNFDRSMAFAYYLFAGALGFLMTQDTYFYPPLVFSASLIISRLGPCVQNATTPRVLETGVPLRVAS